MSIYKSLDGWTAQIITDETGVVDCQIFFKPTSEYARRIAVRGRRYRQPLRLELPEDNRTPAADAVGAWL
jgi:hypothetical protein